MSPSPVEIRPLWQRLTRYGHYRLSTPEERRLAGRISGALWLCGAITLLGMLPIPGAPVDRVLVVAGAAAFAVAWGGVLLLAVPWERAPRWLFHLSTALVAVV